MKSYQKVLAYGVVAAAAVLPPAAHAAQDDPSRWVDPFIGTSGTGHTTPAACVPFGLVQAGPDTGNGSWEYCSGYQHGDKTILGFSQTHLSGTGCPDLGDVRILPYLDFSHKERKASACSAPLCEIKNNPVGKLSEIAEPGYYAVALDGGVKV